MRNVARMLTVAALAAALAAPVAGRADCSNPYAKITQPSGGQVVVNGMVVTSVGGQSLSLSTSGTIEVKIEHDCAYSLDLVVTKTGPGSPTTIHSRHWEPLPCDFGTLSETVIIGLDGGTYRFDVSGVACGGRKLRSDGHGGTIIDPPLPGLR